MPIPIEIDIHRLVSFTFDEDPKVRKEAARKLASVDDPAALFALMELSYDKDIHVKQYAQGLLGEKKAREREVMSFADMFSTGRRTEEAPVPEENDEQRKERVLSPIRQLFEKKLGKERAEAVRSKMMPTIDKVYRKATGHGVSATSADGREAEEGEERQVIQEFLTSYLEAISSVDTPHGGGMLQVEEVVAETPAIPQDAEAESAGTEPEMPELEEVGRAVPAVPKRMEQEIARLEEEEGAEVRQEEHLKELPESMFQKAYETMMLSQGDEKVMRREMKRMIHESEHDIRLAFDLARRKFRETDITHLTKLRNGMGNINTDPLEVKEVEVRQYSRGRPKKNYSYTRLLVADSQGTEAVVYLFEDRGTWVQPGMRIRLRRARVKTFDFAGETALTTGRKSDVYVVV